MTCGEIAEENSALGLLFTRYKNYQITSKKKRQKLIISFSNYIPHILKNGERFNALADLVT